MDGPEQGHTQATDPAAASKDTGAIEPVIKGKHQKKKKKRRASTFLSAVLASLCLHISGGHGGYPPTAVPRPHSVSQSPVGGGRALKQVQEFGAGSEP